MIRTMQTLPGLQVLRGNALFAALLGVLFLLAPSHWLYETLGLPIAQPELFTQLAGVFSIALAALLWEAPARVLFERLVGRAVCTANALSVLVTLLWLVSGKLDVDVTGKVVLGIVTAILAVFALLEARYFQPAG